MSSLEEIEKCENCEESEAEKLCKDCSILLCQNCCNVLHKKKKNHKITGRTDKKYLKRKIFCQHHQEVEFDFFCETHQQFICSKCVLEDFQGKHVKCKRIKNVDYENYAQKKIENNKVEKIYDLKETLNNFINSLDADKDVLASSISCLAELNNEDTNEEKHVHLSKLNDALSYVKKITYSEIPKDIENYRKELELFMNSMENDEEELINPLRDTIETPVKKELSLLETLKKKKFKIAEKEKLRPFQVISKEAVESLAELQPTTLNDLKSVQGFNPAIIRKRGIVNSKVLKIDTLGNIVISNDGSKILRELQISHPASQILVEISKKQHDSIGDGTTSVVLLSCEMLKNSGFLIQKGISKTYIMDKYVEIFQFIDELLIEKSTQIDLFKNLHSVASHCTNTKNIAKFGSKITELAVESILHILKYSTKNDIENYLKVLTLESGNPDDSFIFQNGYVFNGNTVHVEKELISSCKICLSKISFKFSSHKVKVKNPSSFLDFQRKEENVYESFIKQLKEIDMEVLLTNQKIENKFKQLFKNYHITVIDGIESEQFQILSKMLLITSTMSNVKLNKVESLKIIKINANSCRIYMKFNNENPFCSVILKSNSKEMLKEIFLCFKNIILLSKKIINHNNDNVSILPGAGAIELYLANELRLKSLKFEDESRDIYQSVADSIEVIPKLLIENSGNNVPKLFSSLTNKISNGETIGISKEGTFFNSTYQENEENKMIIDPLILKREIYETALESCLSILKVDCIIKENQ
eukprot:gene5272-8890_t